MQHPRHIAIDGPAGSGKSTVGELLARCLGYLYIDTGAMYRAVAWLALQEGVNTTNEPILADLAKHSGIIISHPHIDDGRQYTVTVHGQDVTWDIRSSEVTRVVSVVSAHKGVRAILIAQQRELARQHDGIVMVGRDIGAIVLPDADLKIYLTASLQERARRRYSELVERFGENNPTLPTMEAVLADIQRRDEIDHDNMRPADDAIVIVTDNLSVTEVLEVICSYLEEPA